MNRALLFFFVALFGCASVPKNQIPKSASPSSICPDCPEENKFSVTVENTAPRIFVQAVVNGRTKRFFVDTGAYRSNLAIDEQTKSIAAVGKTQFASFSWQPITCDWIRIDSFQVAGLSHAGMKGGPILKCDSTPPLGNILGLDYLDSSILEFNVDRAEFKSLSSIPADIQTTVMKRSADRHMVLPIRFSNTRQWAVFDTGASFTVVDRELLTRYPHAFKKIQGEQEGKPFTLDFPVALTEGAGKQFMGDLYTTDQLQVGDQRLPNQMVIVARFPKEFKKILSASIILGAASILETNWIFDLSHNLWASSPSVHSSGAQTRFSVHADQVSTQDKTVVLIGDARFLEKGHELSGNRIVYDSLTSSVDCSGACAYKGGTTLTGDSMSFLISDKEWKRVK